MTTTRSRPAAGPPKAPTALASVGRITAERVTPVALAIALGAFGWQLLSMSSDGWVPSLGEIADATRTLLADGDSYSAIWTTLRRMLIVLVISFVVGTVIGVAAGLSRRFEYFVRPILVAALAIPDPVYIIISVLVLGTGESSGLVAVSIAISPLVANVVAGSVRSRDTALDEMGATYRFGWVDYCRHILLGQTLPALFAALRTSFAFSWKLIVLMEALNTTDGVGAQIYYHFRLLQPEVMVAYALLFIIVMRAVETVLFAPVEKRLKTWSTS